MRAIVVAALLGVTAPDAAALAVPTSDPAVSRDSGALLAWGQNTDGQLGTGTITNSSDTPVTVKLPKGTRIVEARAGCFFTVALTSKGEVLAWGDNFDGQLGDGSLLNSKVPVRVHIPAHTTITRVRAGCAFALALTSTGDVLAWGLNDDGQLGDGRAVNAMTPARVKLPRRTIVTGISAGNTSGLALTSKGRVLAWGDNNDGQLGTGNTTSASAPVSAKVPRTTRIVAVASGGFFSLAQTAAGGVLAWGYNLQGELGDGSDNGSLRPVKVLLPGGTKVSQLYAGGSHAMVLTTKGRLLTWGNNASGQLGDGSTANSDVPVAARLPAGTKVSGIAACLNNSLALTSKGRALAWGDDSVGELGNGETTSTPVELPVGVKLPAGFRAQHVSCGPEASVGLAIAR
jgi:alpha-tubulin suppressor-like RCC1 family protein